MTSYRFRCLGPFFFDTEKLADGQRTFDPNTARDQVFAEAEKFCAPLGISNIYDTIGLYVFGLSPSGSSVTWPYYVGRATRQTIYKRLFQVTDKPQKYSRILSEYQRARPFVYIFPMVTANGNQVAVAKKGGTVEKIIADAEYMMIGHAMNVNPYLHNIQDVMAREKFTIDGTPQSDRRETKSAKEFRRMMQFDQMESFNSDAILASKSAYETPTEPDAREDLK